MVTLLYKNGQIKKYYEIHYHKIMCNKINLKISFCKYIIEIFIYY